MDNYLFFGSWLILDLFIIKYLLHLYTGKYFNNNIQGFTLFVFTIFIIAFSTYAFTSTDYYGYVRAINRMNLYEHTNDMEIAYWVLAAYADYDISMFRFCISFVIFSLFIILIKKYSINTSVAIAIFVVFFFYNFISIIRSVMADCIAFGGILYFYKKRNIISFLIALVTISLSLVFHKSSFIIAIIFLFSLLPLNNKLFTIVNLFIPLFLIISRLIVLRIFSLFFDDSSYVESSNITGSQIGFVKIVLVTFIWGTIWTYIMYKGRFLLVKNPRYMFYKYCYKFYYWGWLFWLCSLFSGASRFLSDRIIAHLYIPAILLLSYLFYMNISRKMVQRFALICFFLIQLQILVVWAYHAEILKTNSYTGFFE